MKAGTLKKAAPIWIAFVSLYGPLGCHGTAKDTGRPTSDGEGFPGYLANLKCAPTENISSKKQVVYGCVITGPDGQKYSGPVDGVEILVVDANGVTHKISNVTGGGADSPWSVIFPIPDDLLTAVTEIRGTMTLSGSPQTLVGSSCPIGFILVPGDPFFKTKDFCLMKYEAKLGPGQGANVVRSNVDGEFAIFGNAISFERAKALCTNLGAGFHLTNNDEWMTAATNIANVAENWSGNQVGTGAINKGHSDGIFHWALNASTDDNPCFGAEYDHCTDKTHSDWSQKRTHKLSNGEIIWDLSGNWKEVVDTDILPNSAGTPLPHSLSYVELSSISQVPGGVPITAARPTHETQSWWNDSWNSSQGIGFYGAPPSDPSTAPSIVFARGGGVQKEAGIFHFSGVSAIGDGLNGYGFRCSFSR